MFMQLLQHLYSTLYRSSICFILFCVCGRLHLKTTVTFHRRDRELAMTNWNNSLRSPVPCADREQR